ncbi:hypothetical protein HDA32_003281 [Spinactinospora alkalitolerans]|uniref:Uncharacterized protein n=1 Tax=Spinactinospora alkalitolerans TaxID=687207 RepID=A0A852TWR3_9ACTN|nr:hypothetical protein [Spinactinospora alkalitolerans]NYE48161.1 hypothetical protein [Spinactinospora alkalitolerans]
MIVALLVAAAFAFGGVQRITASFRGETEAIERTEASGDFRIATYEDFFGLCEAVQNAEAQIDSLEQELDTDPPQSRVTQINASLTAIRANRIESINEYNSKAGQEHRQAFQDADLPERLDPDTEETTCVA